jgi:hypothetical protein
LPYSVERTVKRIAALGVACAETVTAMTVAHMMAITPRPSRSVVNRLLIEISFRPNLELVSKISDTSPRDTDRSSVFDARTGDRVVELR